MKPRSELWKSFEKFNKGTDVMARYLFCKRELRANPVNGTAPLRNHLTSCKVKNTPELVGMGLQGEKVMVTYKYDYDAVRRALARMIIMDELPFKFVMGLGFKLFMEVTCPKFLIPSRWTIQRDCYQMFTTEKDKMRDFFKKTSQRICITTDTWTSLQKVNYMCVTAHFIDENWMIHKRLLSFSPIFSHKEKDIGVALEVCLRDWGIDKLFTITVDNATANDVAVSYVRDKLKHKCISDGKYIHLRCVAHILHLIVTDGLDLCNVAVAKVRFAVKYVKHSPGRYTIFKSAVALEDLPYRGWLSLDVRTRWNSTYKMLDAVQKLEQAFVRYEDMDPLFKFALIVEDPETKEKRSMVPTDEDWEKVRKLVTILKRFYNLTLRVLGYKSVSSHSFFHDVANLHTIFQKWKDSTDCSLSMMARPMSAKFEKYWGENKMNMLLYFAGEYLFENVKSALYELFNEYKCKLESLPSSHENVSGSSKLT